MSTHRSGMCKAVTEPPHIWTVWAPSGRTCSRNAYCFTWHRETRKTSRRWPRNVANFKKLRLHKAKRRPLFENEKVDIISPVSGLVPINMCEELPRESPPSLGALYQPIWALSQKGVGGGSLGHPLYLSFFFFFF